MTTAVKHSKLEEKKRIFSNNQNVRKQRITNKIEEQNNFTKKKQKVNMPIFCQIVEDLNN